MCWLLSGFLDKLIGRLQLLGLAHWAWRENSPQVGSPPLNRIQFKELASPRSPPSGCTQMRGAGLTMLPYSRTSPEGLASWVLPRGTLHSYFWPRVIGSNPARKYFLILFYFQAKVKRTLESNRGFSSIFHLFCVQDNSLKEGGFLFSLRQMACHTSEKGAEQSYHRHCEIIWIIKMFSLSGHTMTFLWKSQRLVGKCTQESRLFQLPLI